MMMSNENEAGTLEKEQDAFDTQEEDNNSNEGVPKEEAGATDGDSGEEAKEEAGDNGEENGEEGKEEDGREALGEDLGWGDEAVSFTYGEETLEEFRMPEELVSKWAEKAKEAGMSKSQAELAFKLHPELVKMQQEIWAKEEKAERDALEKELAKEWGSKEEYKNTVLRLSNFVETNLGEYWEQLLFHTPVGAKKEAILPIKKLMDALQEPEFFSDTKKITAVSDYISSNNAREAIDRYYKDNPEARNAYVRRTHPQHERYREEIDAIYKHFNSL